MTPLLRFVAWSNWYIAGAATCMVLTTWWRFGLPVQSEILIFVFLSTLLVYTFQRILKFLYLKQHAELYNWCVKHYRFLLFQCIACLLGLIPLFSRLPVLVLYALMTSAVFSLLYLFVSPFSLKVTGLRHLPFVKSVLIAVVWAMVTSLVPLLAYKQVIVNKQEITWVFIEHLLFIYVLMIPFDIRDMHIDSEKMKTLPQVLGARNAGIAGAVILLLFMLVSEFCGYPRPLAVICAFGITSLHILYNYKGQSSMFHLLVTDGMIYLYALLFWIVNLLA
jgi:hypothetical protein